MWSGWSARSKVMGTSDHFRYVGATGMTALISQVVSFCFRFRLDSYAADPPYIMCSLRSVFVNQDQQQGGTEFPNAERELHMIYGGLVAYESKWKQKLATQEINAVMLVTPHI